MHEKVSVFTDFQSANGGAEDLHAEAFQDAHFIQRNTDVQGTLTTKGQKDAVGTLLLEDIGNIVGRDGEEIDLGGELMGGLPCRDVGVDEDGLDAFLPQCFERLGAGVIEFSSLANAETA